MGSKYGTVAISGYNSAPPPDDGTTSASNKLTWSKHKEKIGDPLKTAVEAINTALVTAFDYSARSVTADDTTVATDHMRTIQIASTTSSGKTISLGDAATMAAGYTVNVANQSAYTQTIGRATGADTINGTATNVAIAPLANLRFAVNAAANGYNMLAGSGPYVDSDALIVGSSDGTKKARFEVDGLTTATTRVMTVPDRDMTLATAPEIGTLVSASGTSVTFTSIPSWVTNIQITVVGLSTTGTDGIIVQVGDSGGLETTGYSGSGHDFTTANTATAGWYLSNVVTSARIFHGVAILTLHDSTNNVWSYNSIVSLSDAGGVRVAAGSKSLSATLDRVSIKTTASDTFDAGSINIRYS